jgi:hypothetical protein
VHNEFLRHDTNAWWDSSELTVYLLPVLPVRWTVPAWRAALPLVSVPRWTLDLLPREPTRPVPAASTM